MQLKSITFTSWAAPGLEQVDIDDIHAVSKFNNARDSVGGLLIYNGAAFLAMLEGERAFVDALVERLRSDRRHLALILRDTRWIDRRSFPDWSMAVLDLAAGRIEGGGDIERALTRAMAPRVRALLEEMAASLAAGR